MLLAAAGLLCVGYVGQQAWVFTRAGLRDDPRYHVTAASIQTPPAPPWVRTDIRLEALRDAGLTGLSIFDPPEQLQARLSDAFRFHPWVESVGAITKRPPNRVEIQLTYRRPLAAVEVRHGVETAAAALWAVDSHAVRLPSEDLTAAELRHLPRVVGVDSTTLPGEVWRDTRVQGAVTLATHFGEDWRGLFLTDIVPRRSPEVFGDLRYPVFDLVTRGGTRIVWGAAPNAAPPGEHPFAAKLARLKRHVAQHGPLDSASLQTPEVLDIRTSLTATARQAMTKNPRTADAASGASSAATAADEPGSREPEIR
ncbi:MAG: hypothetical protein AAF790_05175 [Planctomycetota bacterium]